MEINIIIENNTYHGIKVYNGILEQLKSIHDTEQESLREVSRYYKSFPREVDYNLVQYGSLLVYYDQVREFYKECRLPNVDKMSDNELWERYRRDVGYVVRLLVSMRRS